MLGIRKGPHESKLLARAWLDVSLGLPRDMETFAIRSRTGMIGVAGEYVKHWGRKPLQNP